MQCMATVACFASMYGRYYGIYVYKLCSMYTVFAMQPAQGPSLSCFVSVGLHPALASPASLSRGNRSPIGRDAIEPENGQKDASDWLLGINVIRSRKSPPRPIVHAIYWRNSASRSGRYYGVGIHLCLVNTKTVYIHFLYINYNLQIFVLDVLSKHKWTDAIATTLHCIRLSHRIPVGWA